MGLSEPAASRAWPEPEVWHRWDSVADGWATTGGHNTTGDCNCDCGAGNCCDAAGGDGAVVLLLLAVIVGAVLAIVGFVVAALVAVAVVQIIIRRHLWILEKKTLVRMFVKG